MTAYTYHIFHRPTQRHYYGVRTKKGCAIADLWTTYFTSSKIVADLIEEHGADSFDVEVRKTFDSKEAAREWEHKVLRRLGVRKRTDWLNRSEGKLPTTQGKVFSEEYRAKLSAAKKGKKRNWTPEWKKRLKDANLSAVKGKPKSPEHRAKIAEAKRGKKASEAHRKAISDGLRKRNSSSHSVPTAAP